MLGYYVYVYYHQNIPFYVGMGRGERYLDHIKYAQRAIASNAVRNKLSHKLNKIIKIILSGNEPEILFEYQNISRETAKQLEMDLIKKYGRADLGLGTLCNLTDGGDGVSGRTTMVSPEGESISILKEDKLAFEQQGYIHFNKGRKHSADVNQRKTAHLKGSKRPGHSAKIKEAAARGAYKNRPSRGPHSESTIEKMRAPKTKREGYQNRHWYHSVSRQLEVCINTAPDWPDILPGRLPKPKLI
jgi:hypothetical protein